MAMCRQRLAVGTVPKQPLEDGRTSCESSNGRGRKATVTCSRRVGRAAVVAPVGIRLIDSHNLPSMLVSLSTISQVLMNTDEFAVRAPLATTLPVIGTSARFPVRRIYCVGRNYVAHVREMGGNETRDFPLIFQKPADAVVQNAGVVPYPPMTDDFHFELELLVAMKSGGYDVSQESALSHVYGYGICLDMTRRRLRDTPAGPSLPWELKKSFDHSAPCGPIHPVERVGHPASGRIKLEVDGHAKQDSDLSLMIWRIPEIIATLSKYYAIEPGDLIMTGTPHGVGAVLPGNVLVGTIEGLGSLTVTIGETPKKRA